MFSNKAKFTALAIVHIFETSKPLGDYSEVAVLPDGAGFSVGINQFTHKSGSLQSVADTYITSGGSYKPDKVNQLIGDLKNKSAANIKKVSSNQSYRKLLRELGSDPLWQTAQREVMEKKYLNPAIAACEGSNFVTPMSLAVVYDSKNQGSFEKIRDRVTLKRANFKSDLEFEKAWITSYVQNRDYWLENFTSANKKKQEVIRASDYRTDFFLAQIARNNWNLDLPLNVHGHHLTADIFGKMDLNSVSPSEISESGTIPQVVPPDNGVPPTETSENADNSDALSSELQADDAAKGTVSETVTEKTSDGNTEIEKTSTETKSTFDAKNIPAFIPRFGKQWLLSLIPGGGLLATISAKLADMPDWLVFTLGFFTGMAAMGFLILGITHRVMMVKFLIKCYDAIANPDMHNLIPTSAAGFVGSRQSLIEQAVTK